MGKMIDNSCEPKPMSKEEIVDTLKTMVFGPQAFERFSAKERETLDKAWNLIDQYEARLKADMVAMLTELQLEIEELNMHGSIQLQSYRQKTGRYRQGFERAQNLSTKIIQQKINAIERNADGATSN